MKKAALWIIISIALLMVGCRNASETGSDHNFSVFLVEGLHTAQAMGRDLNDLQLQSTPLLTQEDLLSYDWQEHTFILKDFNLEERLEGKVPLNGLPFVVVADDERIYLGTFWNHLSSLHLQDIPKIYSIWYAEIEKDTYTITNGGNKDPRNDQRIFESMVWLGLVESNN